jgi:hypothetical protein
VFTGGGADHDLYLEEALGHDEVDGGAVDIVSVETGDELADRLDE